MAGSRNIHGPEYETFRELLREARQEAGLKQSELAAKLSVPQSFVSKYENGERKLDVLELRNVCKALNMTLATFVEQLEERLVARKES